MIGFLLGVLVGAPLGMVAFGIFATGGRGADERAARVLPFPPRKAA